MTAHGRTSTVEKFSETVEFEELEQPIRRWPVVVEVVTTYVIWTEGDTYQEAIDDCKRDGCLYERFDKTEAQGGGWEVVENPSPWQYEPDYPPYHGPMTRCAECEQVAHDTHYQSHKGTCSSFLHYPDRRPRKGWGENEGKFRGGCNCGISDREREALIFPWRDAPEEAEADVAAHLVGKQVAS